MKKLLLILNVAFLSLVISAFLRITPPINKLTSKTQTPVGRWERTLANGGVWLWAIRANGTFSVSSKGTTFANGHYQIKNGLYDVNDANCNVAYHGQYRFNFYAKDSIRFSVLEDTCRRRRGGMDGTGWKRISDTE